MSPLDSTCWIGGSVAFSVSFFLFLLPKEIQSVSGFAHFKDHGRYFGHCVNVVHLLQQLTICNCVLEGVKSLALLSGTIH
ncbi:hypothetical protein Gotur_002893 [Gossypium turneri]